jgi:hypothetical protein
MKQTRNDDAEHIRPSGIAPRARARNDRPAVPPSINVECIKSTSPVVQSFLLCQMPKKKSNFRRIAMKFFFLP